MKPVEGLCILCIGIIVMLIFQSYEISGIKRELKIAAGFKKQHQLELLGKLRKINNDQFFSDAEKEGVHYKWADRYATFTNQIIKQGCIVPVSNYNKGGKHD